MILFAGIPSEAPLRLAIEAAERRGVPYVALNQRHAAHVDLCLRTDGQRISGQLWMAGTSVPLDALSGVYARLMDPAALPEIGTTRRKDSETPEASRARLVADLLTDWLEVSGSRIVNRPSAMGSNLSKPFQTRLIRQAGLLTPETVITNDPQEVRAFHATHGRIVYKSVSAVRSIVKEWTPGEGPDLERVRQLPTQFQALVPGVDVRVHVVGRRTFSTQILSDAIDYRYARQDGGDSVMTPTALPDDVAAICVDLTARLGLEFSGIDLKRTPDGSWYCFEVNPSPAYSWFEESGGQPIADALVQLLSGQLPSGSC
jgi:hypothetical protein